MINVLKFMFSSKGLFMLLILGLILFGCQKRSQQEQVKIVDKTEKFLRHAMITFSGVYTLIGEKPVTEFPNLTSEPSRERLEKIYAGLSSKKKSQYSFVEVSSHFMEEYDLWDNWSQIKHLYLGENFRFFPNPRLKDNLIFANLTAVALILDEYYEDFRKAYGQDFDPTEIIHSIDSENSEFWKICFSDHYLSGLLYGFGKTNAKLFSWELNSKKPGKARTGSYKGPLISDNPRITQLPLPSFVVYAPLDNKLLRYKELQKKIIDLYQDRDFKELTLKLLKDNEDSLKELL